MKTLNVETRQYNCHPETCCHEEHFPYWVVEVKPYMGSSTSKWIEGFDTRKEAEAYIAETTK